ADQLTKQDRKKAKNARYVGDAMSKTAMIKTGIFDSVTDETIVCRCEEVTYRDIRTAVANGARDLNDLKRRTRLGMGNCQGTFCGQVANELMWKAARDNWPRSRFTVRQPLRPVPIGCITEVDRVGHKSKATDKS
ncbi:(2Fe-2S)-binding protein, partial [Desulforhopalus singaporensis]|uniref:(2Fe-2S)-binding protein n=1 Tax=Desulforhopalus singaporensis TaxID=91360 RepID=UPI0015A301FC